MGDWPSWLGILLTLSIGAVGFYIGRRNRQRPLLRYGFTYGGALEPRDSLVQGGLKLTFGGAEIDRVVISRFVIWNHRGDTIHSSDEVEVDPLRLEFAEGDEILQVRILAQSRPQIQLSAKIEESKNIARLAFDFLDAGDGAVLEIVHQEPYRPTMSGTIRGSLVREVRRINLVGFEPDGTATDRFIRILRKATNVTAGIAIVLGAAVVALAAFTLIMKVPQVQLPRLVDPGEFDLQSLSGQAEFATRISEMGSLSPDSVLPLMLIVITMPLLLMVVGFLVVWSRRPGVPKSILRNAQVQLGAE